jgi:hypothetical protein
MPASPDLNSRILAHAAFLVVAGLLSMQVSASPAARSAPSAAPAEDASGRAQVFEPQMPRMPAKS